jgi:hypothetical protein
MISFAVAQQLKAAGFNASKRPNAEFFVNEHLKVRREDAQRVWYADQSEKGWELDPEKEMVYCPTIQELAEGCSLPLYVSCDEPGHWYAKKTPDGADGPSGYGESLGDALARLWLTLQLSI